MMSDHTDAAIIIPAAKPRMSVLSLGEISFLKKKTTDAPAAVAINIKAKPSTVYPVPLISLSFVRPYNTPRTPTLLFRSYSVSESSASLAESLTTSPDSFLT